MATKKVEVFSAGCGLCDEAAALVRRIACPSCDIEVLDMSRPEVAEKARRYGVERVPAIAVDGKLADCCTQGKVDEASLRAAGVGAGA